MNLSTKIALVKILCYISAGVGSYILTGIDKKLTIGVFLMTGALSLLSVLPVKAKEEK